MTKRQFGYAIIFIVFGSSLLLGQGGDAGSSYLLMTGRVVLEDGSPAPQTVQAEMICNGQIMRQDFLDSQGRFEFELGSETAKGMTDTSVTQFGDVRSISQGRDVSRTDRDTGGGFSSPSLGRVSLQGCEIRIQPVPGFISQGITLSTRSQFDDPDVGTIVLQRSRNADPAVVTMTTLAAPPEARGAYDLAVQQMGQVPPDSASAIENLEKAVALYPEFAIAWNKLAEARIAVKDLDGARTAYQKAIAADAEYLGPHLGLAKMAMDARDFEKAATLTGKLLELAPDHPQCLYYDGMAHYNLKQLPNAKKSFLQLKEGGFAPSFPMTSFFLAMIFTTEGNLEAAATEFNLYLLNTPAESVPPKLREWITNKLQEWETDGKIKSRSTPTPS